MKNILLRILSICLAVALGVGATGITGLAQQRQSPAPPEPWGPVPNEGQMKYYHEELSAFIHFGVNTYTGVEWGNGKEDPKIFNPTELDTDQWVRALKDAGFKRVIITAKHHDGFNLYPTEWSKHSVESSNWRNGKGDVLLDLSNSCRKYDMDMGLYLSPWDANSPMYPSNSGYDYNEMYVGQLNEILGNPNYGNKDGLFAEVWMDGAFASSNRPKYDIQRWWDTVYSHNPNCVIQQNYGATLRWNGNERGEASEPSWQTLNKKYVWELYDQQGREDSGYLAVGEPSLVQNPSEWDETGGTIWSTPEADTSIRSGWFHGGRKSGQTLAELYFKSVGKGSPFLLNVPPNTKGKFEEGDIQSLQTFRNILDVTFAKDFLNGATATATKTRENHANYGAENVLDGNYDTYWTMDDGSTTGSIEITLKSPQLIDVIEVQEYIPLGQRISKFSIDVMSNDEWQEYGSGQTIGYKRLVKDEPILAQKIRVNIEDAYAVPLINNIAAYKAHPDIQVGEEPFPEEIKIINTNDMTRSSGWREGQGGHWAGKAGETLEFDFTGSKVWLYGYKNDAHSKVDVYLDGEYYETIDLYSPVVITSPFIIGEIKDIPYGQHTIKLVVKDELNPSGKIGMHLLDAYCLDNNGKGAFEISPKTQTISAGEEAEFLIEWKGGDIESAEVEFSTSPITATHGRDYIDKYEQLTFTKNEKSKTIKVETLNHPDAADILSFQGHLSVPENGAMLGFQNTSTVLMESSSALNNRLMEAIDEAEAIANKLDSSEFAVIVNQITDAVSAAKSDLESTDTSIISGHEKTLNSLIDKGTKAINIKYTMDAGKKQDLFFNQLTETEEIDEAHNAYTLEYDKTVELLENLETTSDQLEKARAEIANKYLEYSKAMQEALKPVLSVNEENSTLEMTSPIENAQIRYTRDGRTTPTMASILFTKPIPVESVYYQAALFVDGERISNIAELAFSGKNIAPTAIDISADINHHADYSPQKAIDNNPDSRWAGDTDGKQGTAILTLEFAEPVTVVSSKLSAYLSGTKNHINGYKLEYLDGENWVPIAETTTGQLEFEFNPVTSNKFRLNMFDTSEPSIYEFQLISAPEGVQPPVFKSLEELQALIAEAEQKNKEKYTPESWLPFNQALIIAKRMTNLNNPQTITDAYESLDSAMNSLIEKTDDSVKEELANLIGTAKTKAGETDKYTEDSIQKLLQAIDVAENILNDDLSDDNAYQSAIDDLQTAIDNLVEESFDSVKEELVNLIGTAKTKAGETGKYTEDSIQELLQAIDSAEDILNDDSSDDNAYQLAIDDLQTAIDNLVEESFDSVKEELANLIGTAKTKAGETDKYTDESIQELLQAIDLAEDILNDDSSDDNAYQLAIDDLQTAIDNLVEEHEIPIPEPKPQPRPSRESSYIGSTTPDKPAAQYPAKKTASEILKSIEKQLSDTPLKSLIVNNIGEMPLSLWQKIQNLADIPSVLHADSIAKDGRSVTVRVTVNPLLVKEDLNLEGRTESARINNTLSIFNRYFENKCFAIELKQKDSFNQRAKVAAKVDIGDINPTELVFYSYNNETNSYIRLNSTQARVDKNGYLHFYTEYGNTIIVSHGPLKQK